MTRARTIIAILSMILLVVLAACGDSDSDGTPDSDATTTTQEPEGSLSRIQSAGTIKVASTMTFPPMEMLADDGTPTGLDIDLAKALAEQLGVEVEYVKSEFPAIIPGLQTGRFDIAMASITDTKEREQQVDFVDYANVGTAILVQAGNPESIGTALDLCGNSIGAQTGTGAQNRAEALAEECKNQGLSELEVKLFPGQPDVALAIKSGRVTGANLDYTGAVGFAAQDDGQTLEAVPDPGSFSQPYGLALAKDQPELLNALKDALQELIDNGTYQELLKKWGLELIAVDEATINGAVK